MSDAQWLSLLGRQADPRPATRALCKHLGFNLSSRGHAYGRKPRILDLFPYNGEASLLELRRLELSGVVSQHAHTVNAISFSGDWREVADSSDDALMAVRIEPAEMQRLCGHVREGKRRNFCRESLVRNSLARAVDAVRAADSDWVLIGDVDEVPDGAVVRVLSACDVPHEALVFRSHRHFMWSTRCVVTGGQKQYWTSSNPRLAVGPVGVRVATMRRFGLQAIRKIRYDCHAVGPHATCTAQPAKFVLPPSAWHLSSCMSSAAAVHKLNTFSDPMHTRWSEAAALALGTTRAATNGTLQARMAEIDRLRAGCLDPKGYSRLARMSQPLREYPDVPRALASNAARFADMMLS